MISTPTERRRPVGRAAARNDAQPSFPPITRPVGLPHSPAASSVPEPEHHHLPSWVRRAHSQARPILADQLALLTGDLHEEYLGRITEFVARINSGKFSQAFQYAQLITDGQQLVDSQRRANAEAARAQRAVEAARRRVSDALRDAGDRIAPDAATRLSRALRAASDVDSLRALEVEVKQAASAARGVEERRRDREISRTKSRIEKTTPRGAAVEPAQDWQEVLRRLQEQMAAEERAPAEEHV
jgi:hypothetical protein